MGGYADCWLCTRLRLEYQRLISQCSADTLPVEDPFAEWVRCPRHAEEHERHTLWQRLKKHELILIAADPLPSNRGDK